MGYLSRLNQSDNIEIMIKQRDIKSDKQNEKEEVSVCIFQDKM